MRILVTGSAGHLGEGLMRALADRHELAGLDVLDSPFTTHVGSIADADFVRRCTRGVDAIVHAATLHKPHVATHARSAFVETNVNGTLNVLEAALENRVSSVVFSSTTSAFGAALSAQDDRSAAWVTEDFESVPKNIYGVTKKAAEDLCELFFRTRGLPCLVLRTSRFFPEVDDDPEKRRGYDDLNLKTNELLYRRVDLADAVEAHVLAAQLAPEIGFRRYVVSATTPFSREQRAQLGTDAPAVVRALFPDYEKEYARRGWAMLPSIDRVYVNRRARDELGWEPRFDFRHALDCLHRDEDIFSPLTRAVRSKGYHSETFEEGPYPIESDPRLDAARRTPVSTTDSSTGAAPADWQTSKLAFASRMLLGLLLVSGGINNFMARIPVEQPTAEALAFLAFLDETGYLLQLLAVTELAAGLLLLSGRFVPLALALFAPVVVNILLFHAFIQFAGIGAALLAAGTFGHLVYLHRDRFASVLSQ